MNSFSNINYPVESFLDKLKNGNKKLNCSRHKKNDSVIEMEENTPSTTMSTV